jgi:hemerythrin
MEATGFSAVNCHATQHKVVLQVLREGAQRMRAGEPAPVRQMIAELAVWFPHHAQTMDAALALHLRGVGYDPETGAVLQPQALPAEAISGCGGATCS